MAECIIVVGGWYPQRESAEVYDEVLGRWLRLPHDLPRDGGLHSMGSALLWRPADICAQAARMRLHFDGISVLQKCWHKPEAAWRLGRSVK